MPSSWKRLPTLRHYLAELHVLFSVYEERVTDHFPLFWHSQRSEVEVASASSSAHKEHCCLCAAAELGEVQRSCSGNPLHSAAMGLSGFVNGLKRAFLPLRAFPSDVQLRFPVFQVYPRFGRRTSADFHLQMALAMRWRALSPNGKQSRCFSSKLTRHCLAVK